MAVPAAFMYEALATDGIRLLRVSLDDTPDISCDLLTFSREENPPFYALSYVWGSEDNKIEITINQRPFPITRNLYQALEQWKLKLKDGRFHEPTTPGDSDPVPCLLWVDALCINQQDIDEKSTQVPHIGAIYKSCSRVIAWLGPEVLDDEGQNQCRLGHDEVHLATTEDCAATQSGSPLRISDEQCDVQFNFVPKPLINSKELYGFDKQRRAMPSSPWFIQRGKCEEQSTQKSMCSCNRAFLRKLKLLRSVTSDQACFFKLILFYHLSESFSDWIIFEKSLRDFATRPWFRRIWIAQEMALPTRDPILLVGDYELSFIEFSYIWELFSGPREIWQHVREPVLTIYATIRLRSKVWNTDQSLSEGEVSVFDRLVGNPVVEGDRGYSRSLDSGQYLYDDILLRISNDGLSWEERMVLSLMDVGGLVSTQPHDYIYALLGVACTDVSALPRHLLPNYGTSFKEVYYHYTKHLLLATDDPRLLDVASLGMSGFPSWVPDFRRMYTSFRSDFFKNTQHQQVHLTSDTLHIRGVSLGKCVSAFSNPEHEEGLSRPNLVEILRYFQEAIIMTSSDITGVNSSETLRRWIKTQDWIFEHDPLDDDFYREHLWFSFEAVIENKDLKAIFPAEIARHMERLLTRVVTSRRHFFVLDIGIRGSSWIQDDNAHSDEHVCPQPGDVVFTLSGMRWHYLLTPVDEGTWRFKSRVTIDPFPFGIWDETRQEIEDSFRDAEAGKTPLCEVVQLQIV